MTYWKIVADKLNADLSQDLPVERLNGGVEAPFLSEILLARAR
jgi:hypothetical protein